MLNNNTFNTFEDTVANDNKKAQSYNNDANEVLHQVMTGDQPWTAQTPRVRMSDFLSHIHTHKPNPVVYSEANDN